MEFRLVPTECSLIGDYYCLSPSLEQEMEAEESSYNTV